MSNTFRTDAYKMAMAEAGFPLRMETFYFSFRKGGLQYIPIDLEAYVRSILPRREDVVTTPDMNWLYNHGFNHTPAMWKALYSDVEITAAPKGSWVNEREPILSVRAPSYLVSWLEQNIIRLHYVIQLATKIAFDSIEDCDISWIGKEHKNLIKWVYDEMGKSVPSNFESLEDTQYKTNVHRTVSKILGIVGSSDRVAEVGGRSAITEEMHGMCLEACRDAGITKTANVYQALRLDMKPIGTTGHEHIMRFGKDLPAFRAMRDRRPGIPGYLLDTFSTMGSGIPAALQCWREQPHDALVRDDSGNLKLHYLYALEYFKDFKPIYFFEDGLKDDTTEGLEDLRKQTGYDPAKFLYGYGGHFVLDPAQLSLTRDRVSAVYKLSDSGGTAIMKKGNAAGLGKRSVPGRPVIWRAVGDTRLPYGVIAQHGEPIPPGYVQLSNNPEAVSRIDQSWHGLMGQANLSYTLSPQTQQLVKDCEARLAA